MKKVGLFFMAGALSLGLVNAYATTMKALSAKHQAAFHFTNVNSLVTFTGTRTAAASFYGCTLSNPVVCATAKTKAGGRSVPTANIFTK